MNMNEYQNAAADTAIYMQKVRGRKAQIAYTALGLAGEAGEAAEHAKKLLRDGTDTPEDFEARAEAVKSELGDVLWYLAMNALEWGWSLEAIAATNLAKLQSRKERGVLQGSGSDR